MSLSNAFEDIAYSDTLEADDPDFGDTFTFIKLIGPSWLSVDANGVVHCTQGNNDVFNNIPISIIVEDLGGLSDTLNTTINVVNTNDPPVITTTTLSNALEGVPYTGKIEASDPDIGDTFTFSKLIGPSWLSISGDGTLSGTPANSDVGNGISVSFRVADAGGLADT